MERFENYWKTVRGSQPVETFGRTEAIEPEPVAVDLDGMVERFQTGYQQFSSLWKEIFCPECFEEIRQASERSSKNFSLPLRAWIQILYELAATFHAWAHNRFKVIELVTPLYYARVASSVRETWDMTSAAAESYVEEQALQFEEHKDYLVKAWESKPPA